MQQLHSNFGKDEPPKMDDKATKRRPEEGGEGGGDGRLGF